MRSATSFPSWATWIITMVSVLAISILILSLVLGIGAGQRQAEMRRNQEVSSALQKAFEYRASGNAPAALDEYRRALALDPNNQIAADGVQTMLQAGGGQSDAPVAASANLTQSGPVSAASNKDNVAPVENPAVASPDSPTTVVDVAALWNEAQSALKAGRAQQAVNLLLQVQQSDATFQAQAVADALFAAYLNLADQFYSDDNLEGARDAYEKSLALHPDDTAVRSEVQKLDIYMEMQSYYEADWEKSIELLQALYAQDASYRDVGKRLREAYLAYGDTLLTTDPCESEKQYAALIDLTGVTEMLEQKRNDARLNCVTIGTAVAISGAMAISSSGEVTATVTDIASATGATTTPVTSVVNATLSARGRILYAVRDLNDNRYRVLAQNVAGGQPTALLDDATQPALRNDGQRLAFHNLRNDMAGLSGFDPASGLMIRFTSYAEDSLPSWNFNGSRIVFASNREGDRRWRIYMVWAEQDGATNEMGFGESPAFSPNSDLFAFRGCDTSGNRCGLWLMDSSGANRNPLTGVSNDNHPAWSPDGRSVVFMSDGRDGNLEIYRVDTANRQVLRLTDQAALDVAPTVSPDGQWVAFASNREGAWKLYAVSINGGAALPIASVRGDFGDWQMQKLQWVN